jgi:ribonuclease HI
VIVAAAYCDGGLISRNPSKLGGTFAWRLVGPIGTGLYHGSGVITPAEIGAEVVTNNISEFYALIQCLRALPDGWSGPVHTDSLVTIRRVWEAEEANEAIPCGWLTLACDELRRLGEVVPVHLKGHPNAEALALGKYCGKPVSVHNKWCDQRCREEAERFLALRTGVQNE